MAELYLGVYGTRYEATEPLYFTTEQGVLVFDRVNNRWLNWASMQAKATAEGHDWQPREVGIPSIKWQINNSLTTGQRWAPGLDDTSALPSETVTNGENWVGADTGSGTATPPTGWTLTGDSTCQNFSGTLNIYGDAVTGGGMTQELTVTPGEFYVVEVVVSADTTDDVRVGIDGSYMPFRGGNADGSSKVVSASFKAPDSGTVEFGVAIAGGGIASFRHIRCFLESELTGSGAGVGGGPVDPPIQIGVEGPYMADDVTYWINTNDCKVGFNLDSDPDADLWLTGKQVCRKASISDAAKEGINAQLEALGCAPLPCVTAPMPMTAPTDESEK